LKNTCFYFEGSDVELVFLMLSSTPLSYGLLYVVSGLKVGSRLSYREYEMASKGLKQF